VGADDNVITGRYETAFKEAFTQLETAAMMGLMINYKKKYVKLSNSPSRENYIIINNHNIETKSSGKN
jgi:hypothetical protein